MQKYFLGLSNILLFLFFLSNLSFAYTIEWPFFQYQTFENNEQNFFRGWFDITKNNNPVEADEVFAITIKDSEGNEVEVAGISFYPYVYYAYSCSGETCTESGPTPNSGYNIDFEGELEAGDYKIEVETMDGYIEDDLYYSGKLELPVVNSASMVSHIENGNLMLSWTNPVNQEIGTR